MGMWGVREALEGGGSTCLPAGGAALAGQPERRAQLSAEGGESAAPGCAVGLCIDLGVGRPGKQAGGGVAPRLLGQPLGGQGGGLGGAGDCRVHRLGQGNGVGG